MARNVFTEAADRMQRYAEQHERILVFYSGGKDSLCTLDMAIKAFGRDRVECCFQYFVPGMQVAEKQLEYARERYGVKIHEFPHFALIACLREGTYCDSHYSYAELPDMGPFDLSDMVMRKTGHTLCAMGLKKSDGAARRKLLFYIRDRDNIAMPLLEWNKLEVLAYLKVNNIPRPPTYGSQTTGIGITTPSLRWLHSDFPDDFKKLCRWFPYAPSVIYRDKWYGISTEE